VKEFDIIGDVHGCAYLLEDLLDGLGYRINPWSGVYKHRTRQAIFVGDLIDRGPSQLRVLQIVKGMVDEQAAQIVMGNHEFNALAYATEDPRNPGEFLRPHGKLKNRLQHEAFLNQLTESERSHYLAWFRTLPLWLDLGKLRVVHACWHEPSIKVIERSLGGDRFTSTSQLVRAATRSESPTSLHSAVEVILKGPELRLSRYKVADFTDKDGHVRSEARVKWWKRGATSLRDLADVPNSSSKRGGGSDEELPDVAVSARDRSFSYNGTVPVFYGHYWRQGEPVEHEDWTDYTACVDFSAVNGGTMVAYRWSGERRIRRLNYHPHGRKLIRPTPTA
jgi:hypothetical protein